MESVLNIRRWLSTTASPVCTSAIRRAISCGGIIPDGTLEQAGARASRARLRIMAAFFRFIVEGVFQKLEIEHEYAYHADAYGDIGDVEYGVKE